MSTLDGLCEATLVAVAWLENPQIDPFDLDQEEFLGADCFTIRCDGETWDFGAGGLDFAEPKSECHTFDLRLYGVHTHTDAIRFLQSDRWFEIIRDLALDYDARRA